LNYSSPNAEGYLYCILGSAGPTELPMQRSIEFVQVISLKTAKALGAAAPQVPIVAAEEVIE
jgi:hypothetical protein